MLNLSQSKKKLGYAYLRTPAELAQKLKPTAEFLRRKVAEYKSLQQEIEVLRSN